MMRQICFRSGMVTGNSQAYMQHIKPMVEEERQRQLSCRQTRGIEITFTYHLPTKPVSECSLSYLVFADGTVRVRLTYDPAEDLPSMPEFGVMFKLDAEIIIS